MPITANENGVLHTLGAVTSNEGGVLHELSAVHANENGVLNEIFSSVWEAPTALRWTFVNVPDYVNPPESGLEHSGSVSYSSPNPLTKYFDIVGKVKVTVNYDFDHTEFKIVIKDKSTNSSVFTEQKDAAGTYSFSTVLTTGSYRFELSGGWLSYSSTSGTPQNTNFNFAVTFSKG